MASPTGFESTMEESTSWACQEHENMLQELKQELLQHGWKKQGTAGQDQGKAGQKDENKIHGTKWWDCDCDPTQTPFGHEHPTFYTIIKDQRGRTVSVETMIDTGAGHSVISRKLVEAMGLTINDPLGIEEQPRIRLANGETTHSLGMITLQVIIDDVTKNIRAVVLEDLGINALILGARDGPVEFKQWEPEQKGTRSSTTPGQEAKPLEKYLDEKFDDLKNEFRKEMMETQKTIMNTVQGHLSLQFNEIEEMFANTLSLDDRNDTNRRIEDVHDLVTAKLNNMLSVVVKTYEAVHDLSAAGKGSTLLAEIEVEGAVGGHGSRVLPKDGLNNNGEQDPVGEI